MRRPEVTAASVTERPASEPHVDEPQADRPPGVGEMNADAQARRIAEDMAQRDSVALLAADAVRVDALIGRLHELGVGVDAIAATAGALNRRLFARAWALVAPEDVIRNSCLLVMGSEGRGEQLLKTDQDNALILRDGLDPASPRVVQACTRFSDALLGFGYPPCAGRIMVTNALWRQDVASFRRAVRQWVYSADHDGPMHLAIFMDAAAAAGDAALLANVRSFLYAIVSDHDGFLARFAAAADQFGDDAHWWSWLTHRPDAKSIDIKKRGTFPIVHGVRALAIQSRVTEASTLTRLWALVDGRHIDARLGNELAATLRCLMEIRLDHQLKARAAGMPPDNRVRTDSLDVDRGGQLQVALKSVRRFRQFLRQHFGLDRF